MPRKASRSLSWSPITGRSAPTLYKGLPGAFLETYTLDGKGRTPAKGEIFKNPALAKTLRLIGEKGRDAFYKGEIADKIDDFMQANGGYLRKADFEKHTAHLGRASLDELPRLRCLSNCRRTARASPRCRC